ncbi:gap junction protein alpha 10 a [Gadus morhua]|uniref:gap junction protein alpha 10 a n=1 Tax=Gadus morhua TaxID=8049 RepID=UPI0011B4A6DC|nr:gap junction alpha-10 protein-like [Gadus morhua]
MGDWNLLGSILEEVHVHSTIVGKIWLTILFIFRMLVLGVAAEDVWEDEQTEFVCNTDQPGCKAVCYDRAFPISLVRFWVLQVIFVSAPSLVYMGHALYRIRFLDKERHRRRAQLRDELGEPEVALEEHRRLERALRRLEEQRRVKKVPLRGSLLRTYIIHILTRSVVEVCFILGQYVLYGLRLEPLYKCERLPCPNSVDCYISRPTEKTIFMAFMFVIAAVSLFLNLLEISHLGVRKIRQTIYGDKYSEEDSLIYKPKKKRTLQHLCLMRHLSPHNGPSTQTLFKGIPEGGTNAVHQNMGLRANQQTTTTTTTRHNSLAPLGHYQTNCIAPGSMVPQNQYQTGQEGATQGLQTHEGPETNSRALMDQHPLVWPAVPCNVEGWPKEQTQYPEELLRPMEPPRVLQTQGYNMAHRPSLAARDMEEDVERKYSIGSDLFHLNHRKTSFMVKPPSESMSTISGSSSPSIHSSEESDELGSLQGDMPMMPPAGGRRMSMSVFLDISSIMKK